MKAKPLYTCNICQKEFRLKYHFTVHEERHRKKHSTNVKSPSAVSETKEQQQQLRRTSRVRKKKLPGFISQNNGQKTDSPKSQSIPKKKSKTIAEQDFVESVEIKDEPPDSPSEKITNDELWDIWMEDDLNYGFISGLVREKRTLSVNFAGSFLPRPEIDTFTPGLIRVKSHTVVLYAIKNLRQSLF